jgi:hypothetical protein
MYLRQQEFGFGKDYFGMKEVDGWNEGGFRLNLVQPTLYSPGIGRIHLVIEENYWLCFLDFSNDLSLMPVNWSDLNDLNDSND